MHDDYLWSDLAMDARNRAAWAPGHPPHTKPATAPPTIPHPSLPLPPAPHAPPPHASSAPTTQPPQPPPSVSYAAGVKQHEPSGGGGGHHHPPPPVTAPAYLDAGPPAGYPYEPAPATRQLPHPLVQPGRQFGGHLLSSLQGYETGPPPAVSGAPPAPQQPAWHAPPRAYPPLQHKPRGAGGYPAPYGGGYPGFAAYGPPDDNKEIMDRALQDAVAHHSQAAAHGAPPPPAGVPQTAPASIGSADALAHMKGGGRASMMSSVSDDLHAAFGLPGSDPSGYPSGETATSHPRGAPLTMGTPYSLAHKVGVAGGVAKNKQRRRYAKPKSSRYCHLCARHERAVPMFACGNLDLCICQKSVCLKCFEMYGLDLAAAKAPRVPGAPKWTCPHCQGNCPKKAKCHSYDRQTIRRRMRTIATKMGMMPPAQAALGVGQPGIGGGIPGAMPGAGGGVAGKQPSLT